MIVLIQGLTGHGKTFFLARMLKKQWDIGTSIYPNFPLWFDNARSGITRWHVLDDTFYLENGIIVVDESQKIFNARRWQSLPVFFVEKIAEHRHQHLDIISTAQHISHIDKRVRDNIHELYTCESILRFPRNQRVKPILQIVRVKKQIKISTSDNKMVWRNEGKKEWMFISKYWSKTYYNTYSKEIGQSEYVCKIKLKTEGKRDKWKAKIYSLELIKTGKARL